MKVRNIGLSSQFVVLHEAVGFLCQLSSLNQQQKIPAHIHPYLIVVQVAQITRTEKTFTTTTLIHMLENVRRPL
jgi:hypothetical protein